MVMEFKFLPPLTPEQEAVSWIPVWDIIETEYQTIRFYETEKDMLVLTLNKFVQFIEGEDEQIYHTNLILPALAINPEAKRFLILGGGDGLAARTILEHKPDADITLVELDPQMIELFRTHPRLKDLNEGALDECNIYIADALYWVPRHSSMHFDIILCDFPDPTNKILKKLYSESFLSDVAYLLAPNGVVSIQCNVEITSQVDEIIKGILDSSAVIEYEMPCLDEGSMVIGRKE